MCAWVGVRQDIDCFVEGACVLFLLRVMRAKVGTMNCFALRASGDLLRRCRGGSVSRQCAVCPSARRECVCFAQLDRRKTQRLEFFIMLQGHLSSSSFDHFNGIRHRCNYFFHSRCHWRYNKFFRSCHGSSGHRCHWFA